MSTYLEKKCPVCLNKSFEDLINFGEIPKSDFFLQNPIQRPPKIELSFEYCNKCAFIRQKSFKELHNYSEDERKTKHLSPDYSIKIVESLHKKGIKNNNLIVDIGCNDGSFLDVLSKSGFKNLLGIEPSISCSKICVSKGYKTENRYFNKKEADKIKEKYGLVDVVVCRHVLEHIKDPFQFITAIKKIMKRNGIFFIEIPNANNIIYNLKAYDLWDEHLNHFTPNNLENIILRENLKSNKVLIKSYVSTNTILLWGSINYGKRELLKDCSKDVERCKKFNKNWEDFSKKLLKKIKKTKKPIIGIGAAHPQTNFLIFSGIEDYVSKLIDDDPNKFEKYAFAPNPIPIISTQKILKSNFSGTILKTAFGYDSWMNKICNSQKNAKILEIY